VFQFARKYVDADANNNREVLFFYAVAVIFVRWTKVNFDSLGEFSYRKIFI
jgi:hypothetical protein